MNGIQIEYLLGLFFIVVGLAKFVVKTAEKAPALVEFVAGVILFILAILSITLIH